jgi:hypothetical protein
MFGDDDLSMMTSDVFSVALVWKGQIGRGIFDTYDKREAEAAGADYQDIITLLTVPTTLFVGIADGDLIIVDGIPSLVKYVITTAGVNVTQLYVAAKVL